MPERANVVRQTDSGASSLESPGTIRVSRRRTRWRDVARSYKVLIDDEPVGKVRRGRAADFPVQPGRHRLRLKIDWKGSDELSVQVGPGEVALFVCQPNGTAVTAGPDLLRKDKPWIALSKDAPAR